jgi:hypothetical protein
LASEGTDRPVADLDEVRCGAGLRGPAPFLRGFAARGADALIFFFLVISQEGLPEFTKTG